MGDSVQKDGRMTLNRLDVLKAFVRDTEPALSDATNKRLIVARVSEEMAVDKRG